METENEILENESHVENGEAVTEKPRLSYEDLEAELKRVRHEAASRRIELKELKEKASQWDEYQESQKTELQKLQEALAEKERILSQYQVDMLRRDIAKEFGLDSEDAELLTGSDEASIRKQAERLKARLGTAAKADAPRPVDLLAGNRGTPVGVNSSTNIDDLIRAMARQ